MLRHVVRHCDRNHRYKYVHGPGTAFLSPAYLSCLWKWPGAIPLPQQVVAPDLGAFVGNIYPLIESNLPPPPKYFLKRVTLAPQNNSVNGPNNKLSA